MGLDIVAERKHKKEEEKKREERAKKRSISQKISDFADSPPAAQKYICSQCGELGKQKLITKGSILVELAAWMFGLVFIWFFFISMIVPIVYSAWRHLSRTKGCGSCHGAMIKTDSPLGKKLLAKTAQ